MSPLVAQEFLPVELVFNPNWWYHTAGISFDQSFYFDSATRLKNDVIMRRVLSERYGELGLGEATPQPRPIIGSLYVAGGFVIPALLGAEIGFAPNAAPQPKPLNLSLEQIEALEKPDFRETWPMNQFIAQMDALEADVKLQVNQYLNYLRKQGYHAEGITRMGVDVVDEISQIAPEIMKKFPDSIFFGGQLVFPEGWVLTRWLHNYTVFAIQRKFYYQGIPVVMLPIRV